MKLLATAIAFLCVSPCALADDSTAWNVTVSGTVNGKFTVTLQTKQDFPSSCLLDVTRLGFTIGSPGIDPADPKPIPGIIYALIRKTSQSACQEKSGPHYATMTFEVGSNFPQLRDGNYRLFVNDDSSGVLSIQSFKAAFILDKN